MVAPDLVEYPGERPGTFVVYLCETLSRGSHIFLSLSLSLPLPPSYSLISVLGLAGEHQLKNASLSIQLCRSWLQTKGRWRDSKGIPVVYILLL